MRVLITGANGQVGRALLASSPAGSEVRAVRHAQLDVTDPVQVQRVMADFAPTVVVNAAAYTAVDKAESEPELAQWVNAHGPAVLAEAVSKAGNCRLLQISTDFVFDGKSSTPYAPDAIPKPLGVYGQSKLEGERAVMQIAAQHSIVLRTAWVYAASGSNFLRTMLRLMAERGAVRVVCDQVGTPTSAASVAQALWALASRPQLRGIFHWTDAGVASWYDLAVAIAEEGAARQLLPQGIEVTPIVTSAYPTPAKRPAYSLLDKQSTLSATGLALRHWRTSLRAVMEEIADG